MHNSIHKSDMSEIKIHLQEYIHRYKNKIFVKLTSHTEGIKQIQTEKKNINTAKPLLSHVQQTRSRSKRHFQLIQP